MKNTKDNYAELLVISKRIERVTSFFSHLRDIGFIVQPNTFCFEEKDFHYIKHPAIPDICTMFSLDQQNMTITSFTVERASWIVPKEKGGSVMSCDDFVKWLTLSVRDKCNDILSKLDNKTF